MGLMMKETAVSISVLENAFNELVFTLLVGAGLVVSGLDKKR